MAHGDTMKLLAKKGIQPNKTWGKILSDDMKLDTKEAKAEAETKKKILKDKVKECKM